MTFYLLETGDFETSGPFYSKDELVVSLEQFDADDIEAIKVSEIVRDEGTARDVTEDIAREIANAFEFESDEDFDQEDIPAFALLHCEDEMRSDWLDGAREARTVASDQAVFRQAVA